MHAFSLPAQDTNDKIRDALEVKLTGLGWDTEFDSGLR